jgi:hypothetical protein
MLHIFNLSSTIAVAPQRFELQPAEPKSDVLPLHHGAIPYCFVKSSAKI